MTLTDASYFRDDDSDGFAKPSPPIRTGSASRLRFFVMTRWSVTAGIKTSDIARSSGASRSVISGSVLRQYVQRCRRPTVKATQLA